MHQEITLDNVNELVKGDEQRDEDTLVHIFGSC